MKIENPKELKAIIQLCRKLGVQSIKIDGIEFHLGDLPQKTYKEPKAVKQESRLGGSKGTGGMLIGASTTNATEATKVPVASEWDMLTDEQKLFYSTSTLETGEQ